MGRAPCCVKMGLKRGPWSAEEDQMLISHVQRHGHENWRALPKQAGLLRCGKSCRLRWVNYLRPDVKRGNLTAEEEETIIGLHEKLGNKWSAIAARLPGRTDNELKNVWHTHLKKRVNTNPAAQGTTKPWCKAAAPPPASTPSTSRSSGDLSCSGTDSSYVTRGSDGAAKAEEDFSSVEFPGLDESFWKDVFSVDDYNTPSSMVCGGRGGGDGGGGDGGELAEWRLLMDDFQYDERELELLLTVMDDAGDSPAL